MQYIDMSPAGVSIQIESSSVVPDSTQFTDPSKFYRLARQSAVDSPSFIVAISRAAGANEPPVVQVSINVRGPLDYVVIYVGLGSQAVEQVGDRSRRPETCPSAVTLCTRI